MTLWTMVAVIVIAGVVGETIKAYFKSKEKSGANDAKVNERLMRYEQEMDALRKRVRNLEAIAAGAPGEGSVNPRGARAEKKTRASASFLAQHQ